MSVLKETDFKSLYGTTGTLFPDNTTSEISESDMRSLGEDTADSFWNKVSGLQTPTTTGGTTTAYTLAGGITSYSSGFALFAKVNATSTGASTLNVNSVGAKKIFISPTVQATRGDLVINQIYLFVYDSALDSATGGFLAVGLENPNIEIETYSGNAQTLDQSDNNKMIRCTDNDPIEITLDGSVVTTGFKCVVRRAAGAGPVVFLCSGTIESYPSGGNTIEFEGTSAIVTHLGSNVWAIDGSLSITT